MSRHPRPAERPPRLRRLWSFLRATVRSALSWMRSSPTRTRAALLRRRQAKAERLLLPLLVRQAELLTDSLLAELQQPPPEPVTPVLVELGQLLGQQQETLRVLQELLMAVLDSLQPDPSEEISRLAGPPPLPSSLPSSES